MSRLDCGPSLYNYTAALSGAHLVFPSASLRHLAPISPAALGNQPGELTLCSTQKLTEMFDTKLRREAHNIRNGCRDYQPGAQGRKSSQIFWIRPTRPSAEETVSKCLEKAKLLYPSGIITFVFAGSADSRPPKGLMLAARRHAVLTVVSRLLSMG